MSKKALTFAFLAFFVTVGFVAAQEGKITGKVADDQGNALPGVTVEAISPKLVGKAATVTDDGGSFRLLALPSGTYEMSFSLQGFRTLVRKDILLQMSQTIVINVTLTQAAIEEQVTVVGQSPLIDVKSTVKGMTMTKEMFMSLPRSRNFDGLLSTVPGVQYDNVGGGLLVDGATGTENMWYMDGSDITQPHIGTRGQGAVMELVEEVKVTASGYNAEFGGSMGGVVNVITRSGGNSFHGDIIGFYEDHSTVMYGKARDYGRWDPYDDEVWEYVNDDDLYFDGGSGRDPYTRFEGVFSLGGYLWKDRLWFFGSFNPQYSDETGMRGFDSAHPEVRTQEFHRYDHVWNGQFKLTAAPLAGMRISASFVNNWSNYRGAIPSINGTSSSTYAWDAEGYDYPNYSAAALLDYSISNSLLMSVRGGYAMSDTTNQQIAPTGTSYYFNYSNYIYQTDPYYVANPSKLHYAGYANSSMWQETQKYKLEKYSVNTDLTYYVEPRRRACLESGRAVDPRPGRRVPGRPLSEDHPPLGPGLLRPGHRAARHGQVRALPDPQRLDLDLRLELGHSPEQLVALPPGFLDDRRQADHQCRRPDRERVHPRLHERPERRGRLGQTGPVRLRRKARPQDRPRL